MFEGKNILIVDDEPDLREITAFEFEMKGATVFTAASGNEAFSFLSSKDSEIHLVVSDVRMPDGTGEELLKKMNDAGLLDATKIVLVTGFADLTREAAIEGGALELFYKPVDWPKLLEFVDDKI